MRSGRSWKAPLAEKCFPPVGYCCGHQGGFSQVLLRAARKIIAASVTLRRTTDRLRTAKRRHNRRQRPDERIDDEALALVLHDSELKTVLGESSI